MNGSIFWRLIWKEYRVQRGFWLGMAALTLAVQGMALVTRPESPEAMPGVLVGIALAMAAFYGLGSGATLFATERETETYEFQRAMPVKPLRVFAGKVAYAFASTAALAVVLVLLSLVLTRGQVPDPNTSVALLGLWGMAIVEALVWGIFFSLLLKRPLVAVILAVTCASLTIDLLRPKLLGQPGWDAGAYLGTLPARAAVAALLAIVDVWLGAGWLREKGRLALWSGWRQGTATEAAEAETRGRESAGVPAAACPPLERGLVLRRLVWQHLRQSAPMIAALAAMLVPGLLFAGWNALTGQSLREDSLAHVLAVLGALLGALLLGSFVFLADQTGSKFRFLAERGLPAGIVWLSRQLTWLAVLAAALLLATPFLITLAREGHRLEILGTGLCMALTAYAGGQLCSMFFRSGILAATCTVGLSLGLLAWTGLMASLDISLVWSLAPLPLAFLVATRLRAPGWLLEQNTLRAWLGPVLALALPAAAILIAVPLVRMYEVPWADPGIALEPITAEQRQTAGLYLEAANRMIPIAPPLEAIAAPVPKTSKAPARQPTLDELHALYPRQIEWLKKNEAVLALALQISRRPGQTGLGMAWHGQSTDGFYDNVGYLVLLSGRQLESQGKLDAALERYLAVLRMAAQLRGPGWSAIANQFELMVDESLWLWATRPGQTPQRIAAAIQAVAQIAAARKSPREFIESDYRRARAYLAIDPDLVGAPATDENAIELVNLYARWLPWERARALRALNVMAAEELEKCRQAEVAGSSSYLLRPSDLGLAPGMEGPANRSPFSVVSTAIISEAYRRGQWTANLLLKVPLSDSQMLVSDWLVVETRCRATQVILALEAWRLEHKALPKTLDELVGPYLQRVPIDPFAREPFRYLPAGLSTPLAWYPQQFAPAQTIAPGKPLLWSTGRLVKVVDRGAKEPRKRYVIVSPGQVVSPGTPITENDVWRAGWAFPIP